MSTPAATRPAGALGAAKVDPVPDSAQGGLWRPPPIRVFRRGGKRPIRVMCCQVQPVFRETLVRDLSSFFLRPRLPAHRQYEALRAFYVDRLPAKTVAARFGYKASAFDSLRRDFARRHRATEYFREAARRPWSKRASKKSRLREIIVELRKQYWSIYDIADELQRGGQSLDPSAIFRILRSEGFAKLPRRLESERRGRAGSCRAGRAQGSMGSTTEGCARASDAEAPGASETLAGSAATLEGRR